MAWFSRLARNFAIVMLMICLLSLAGCHPSDERDRFVFPPPTKSDCLPNLALLDQTETGRTINLSFAQGRIRPIIFIYTGMRGDLARC